MLACKESPGIAAGLSDKFSMPVFRYPNPHFKNFSLTLNFQKQSCASTDYRQPAIGGGSTAIGSSQESPAYQSEKS